MSRLDNVDSLEKQLADLHMTKDVNTPSRIKKIPPAVPPKKKAQPQVPRSAIVSTLCEPSFSTKISPTLNSGNVSRTSNFPTNASPSYREYANINQNNSGSQYVKHNPPISSKVHNVTYSNVFPYQSNQDKILPSLSSPPLPPPPPPPTMLQMSQPLTNNNQDEYFPPPSPVSSNYSELVRATTNQNYVQERPPYPPIYQNEYIDYGNSQALMYESFYEPINLHSHQTNNNFTQYYENALPSSSKSPLPKEEEVDVLTNLLVSSISNSQNLDVFGVCVKCHEKILGENSGCTAMGNMYHVKCFSCHHCNINLQGKPFYAVEGQPFCEMDYYETLEKCSVCGKPILDRILRATGKPYHPNCFTCVVCNKSLDGIPFTVDAMNQIHCIEDFHKKFAPRCCVCELPIMPEEGEEETVRVVALDRSFHVRCYSCEDCGLLLSSEAKGRGCYPLDDHILCKTCNANRIRLLTNVMTTDL